ncbi:DUF1566 domain-containing protein [Leucothrix sargassi]|nr:DUF1566 domain-containing protein [Leucothrix sargassi]
MITLNKTIWTLLISLAAQTGFAQTCTTDSEPTTPTSRFILNGDEVTDKQTGLIWQRCTLGQTWNEALQSCDGSAVKNNWLNTLDNVPEGWRVPNIREVNSITEFTCSRPSINLTVFPNTLSDFYWSSTPFVAAGNVVAASAWGIFHVNNGIPGGINKDAEIYVRLVKNTSE